MRSSPTGQSSEPPASTTTGESTDSPIPAWPASANAPLLPDSLAGLPAKPVTAASAAAAADCSQCTEATPDQASVAADDHFSALPDELIVYVASFASSRRALAGLSSGNHRLRSVLQDERLSAQYVGEAAKIASLAQLEHLLAKLSKLPPGLQREPAVACFTNPCALGSNDERVGVFEQIAALVKKLPPSHRALLLSSLATYIPLLPSRAWTKAFDEIFTQVASLPAKTCPEAWGSFDSSTVPKMPHEEHPLLTLTELIAKGWNATTVQNLEKISQAAARLPAKQHGPIVSIIACLHLLDDNDTSSFERSGDRLNRALDEIKELPSKLRALAVTLLGRRLFEMDRPGELVLEKLMPAIIALAPEHRARPLREAGRVFSDFPRRTTEAETLGFFTVLCEQVTQLPLKTQWSAWGDLLSLLLSVPPDQRRDAAARLREVIHQSPEAARHELLKDFAELTDVFGISLQGDSHAAIP